MQASKHLQQNQQIFSSNSPIEDQSLYIRKFLTMLFQISSFFLFFFLLNFISSLLIISQQTKIVQIYIYISLKKIQEISGSRALRNSIPNVMIRYNQLW
jgi:hypothetical protein